jgi:hypothetical protein
MGNHQVRFLGEGAAEMPLPYPTPCYLLAQPLKYGVAAFCRKFISEKDHGLVVDIMG